MAYAETTTVPVAKTQGDIKKLLRKVGADRVAMFESSEENFLLFEIPTPEGVSISYKLSAPIQEGRQSLEQRERSAWRALLLLVKAKTVAIDQGITTIEREFMGDTVMPGGTTLIDHYEELVAHNYQDGPPQIGFDRGSQS